MSDQPKREPVLKDIRDNLQKIVDLSERVVVELNTVHDMLDKDIFADQKALVQAESKPEEKSPNIRFDMNQMSSYAIEKLEEAIKSLDTLQGKIHLPEPKTAPRGR